VVILLLFIAFWLGLSWKYSFVIFGIVILFLLIFIGKRHGKKILFFAVIISAVGIAYSYLSIDLKRERYEGFVYESKDNYFLILSGGERLYCYVKDHDYEIGDYLSIVGDKQDLSFTQIESSFNFESFLNHRGVKYRLYPKKISVNFKNPIRLKFYRKWFLSHFDKNTKSLIDAILFSNKDETGSVERIGDLHLATLVSASGVYIYFFLRCLEFLLSFKLKEKWAKFLPLFFLTFYGIFTFPRFTIIRILVMSLARWLNHYALKNYFSNHSVIGIVGSLFLLLNPFLAYQDSFILGFGIPIFFTFINKITDRFTKYPKKMIETAFLLVFFLPFELKYYQSVSLLSPIAQVILTPLFLLLGGSSLLSFYGLPIYPVVNFFGLLITYIIKPISFLKIEIHAGEMRDWMVLIYYFLYGAFIYYLANGFRIIYRPISITLLSFLLIYLVPFRNVTSNQVSFINVGQGDACLIREQNKTILIDTGGSIYRDIAKDCLIPYFKKQKIYDIDYVITTHDDFDHSGSLDSLQDNFRIRNYIHKAEDFPFCYGNITIENYNQHIATNSDENEQSLVLGFRFMKRDFLIMGDAPIAIEKKMMKDYSHIPCDVLKIGHHGSSTSTSYPFIKFLSPKEAIISVGFNYYGHPSNQVLNILKKADVSIRRTDLEGTIDYFNYIFM